MAEPTGSLHDPSELTVDVTRAFDEPAEQVFDAWLDADNAGRWLFATADGEMERVEIDPRVGGEFAIVEKRGDVVAGHFGTYAEIDRPRRLVFTLATDNKQVPSRVTVEIDPLDRGCDVSLTHQIDAKWEDYLEQIRSGWTTILDNLAKQL